MKIAIPTNDRITVAERTGRAQEFAVFEITDGKVIHSEYRKNTHENNHSHSHKSVSEKHSHSEVIKLLKDIDTFFVIRLGKYMKSDLESGGIAYEITEEKKLEKIVNRFLSD